MHFFINFRLTSSLEVCVEKSSGGAIPVLYLINNDVRDVGENTGNEF